MSVDVERAVRDALAARAAQITPERLQPAVPPTAMAARRSASSIAGRVGWLLVAGAAVLLVAVVFALRPAAPGPARPVPEQPAGTVTPSVSPSAEPYPRASPRATGSTQSPLPYSRPQSVRASPGVGSPP